MKDKKTYKSSSLDFRVHKHIDSEDGVKLLEFALLNNLNIYLPTRTPEDGEIKQSWGHNFINAFKKANNKPYPKYI